MCTWKAVGASARCSPLTSDNGTRCYGSGMQPYTDTMLRAQNAQHRSLFAHTYLSPVIRASGYIPWGASDPRIDSNTTMAEYQTYGPGFNLTGRLNAGTEFNLTEGPLTAHSLLTEEEYVLGGYDSVETVFQDQDGNFGYTEWIDRTPWS